MASMGLLVSPTTKASLSAPDSEVEVLRRKLALLQKELDETKRKLNVSDAFVTDDISEDDGSSCPEDPFSHTFHSIIIFGAEGNLATKKTFPALFALMRQLHISSDVAIVGFTRATSEPVTSSVFLKNVKAAIYNVTHPESDRQKFLSRVSYMQGNYDNLDSFGALRAMVEDLELRQEKDWKGNAGDALTVTFRHVRTFYMAVPPFLYSGIAGCCRSAGLRRNSDRFILEKPFGKDTESCAELCAGINEALSESQLYRIDHYLGKELVMNVLVMRFANISFNAIWNRHHIESVQVLCKETIGTAGRGGYFDEYGIIRDVMQNHLLQIVALVGMEQPLSLSAEHIRQEKVKLLHAVQPLEMENLLVGQFVADPLRRLPSYVDDPTIDNKATTTETYATAVLAINNPRWSGVPFILKAGKALDESKVEVRIRFHGVPGAIPTMADCPPNELVICIQPVERIYWKIISKAPGFDFHVETRRMDLLYAQEVPGTDMLGRQAEPLVVPGAYERLILEVLRGDQTNFVHADELIASWRIFTPALHELRARRVAPEPYVFGSKGPPSEAAFAARFGFPNGFAHAVHDTEKIRRPIAWGKSSVVSMDSRRSSAAESPSGSVVGSPSVPIAEETPTDSDDESEPKAAAPLSKRST